MLIEHPIDYFATFLRYGNLTKLVNFKQHHFHMKDSTILQLKRKKMLFEFVRVHKLKACKLSHEFQIGQAPLYFSPDSTTCTASSGDFHAGVLPGKG